MIGEREQLAPRETLTNFRSYGKDVHAMDNSDPYHTELQAEMDNLDRYVEECERTAQFERDEDVYGLEELEQFGKGLRTVLKWLLGTIVVAIALFGIIAFA